MSKKSSKKEKKELKDVFGTREWREENANRCKRMAIWYEEDCRNNPEHPKHGVYTGLAQLAREGKLTKNVLGE